jgi:acyl-CoA thioesterase-1
MMNLKKYLHILMVFTITVLLIGCDNPKLQPIKKGGSILAFGDSLTYGVGTTKINSYPAVLAKLTGLTVVNAGISGETTDRGLIRLPEALKRLSPDLLILIEGGNDILQNRRHAEIKQDLKAMIEMARNRGIPVVLIGIPQKRLFSNTALFYKELAEEFQLVFDGVLMADLLRSRSLKSDQVHFNKNGYQKMAESIYDLLEENGALSLIKN